MSAPTNVEKELTYRVVDATDGGIYNRITRASNETGSEPIPERNQKRLLEAMEKKQGWQSRYDHSLYLTIVTCDQFGFPLTAGAPTRAEPPAKPKRVRSRWAS